MSLLWNCIFDYVNDTQFHGNCKLYCNGILCKMWTLVIFFNRHILKEHSGKSSVLFICLQILYCKCLMNFGSFLPFLIQFAGIGIGFPHYIQQKSIFQTWYPAVKTIEICKMQKISQVPCQVSLFHSGKRKENKCISNYG